MRPENRNSRYLLIIRIGFLIGVIFCIYTCIITYLRHQSEKPLNPDTAVMLTDGWYLAKENDREPVSLPAVLQTDREEVTLYYDLTEEELEKGIFMIQNFRQVTEIFCDGEEIGRLGYYQSGEKTSVNEYIVARLPDDKKEAVLSVRFSGLRDGICTVDNAFVCTPSEAFVHLAFMDGFNLILIVVLSVLTAALFILALFLCIKGMEKAKVICVFLLLFSITVWVMTNTWIAALLPFSNQVICLIGYSSMMLMPMPVGAFAYYSTINYKSDVLFRITGFSNINLIIQQILYGLGMGELYEMLPLSHMFLILISVISMIVLIKDYRIRKTSLGFMQVMTFVLPLLIIGGSVITFWIGSGNVFIVQYMTGILLFLILLTGDSVYSLLENAYQNKKSRTELDILHKLSVKDGLTDLGNRRAFDIMIESIEKKELDDALLFFMDVNGLKTVNDSMGHKAGDELIIAAANCIREVFELYGQTFRLGGDEFAAVIENPRYDADTYMKLFDRQVEKNNQGRNLQLSIARGCESLYYRNGIRKNISLWKSNADRQMYADKMRTRIMVEDFENAGIVSDNIDEMTGILNIEGFRKNALHLIYANPETEYAIWYIDIKKFKFVNEFFGYEVGDRMIQYFSRLILQAVGEGETCGRLSGSTMLAIMKMSKQDQLEEYFRYLSEHIGEFFKEAELNYHAELAAGVYCMKPEDRKCPDINKMLDWANIAKESIRKLNGDTYAVFGEEMWERQWRDLFINQTLEDALEARELAVWLQPQYNYVTGRITCAEVLCRWTHSTLGWLSPMEFIPALEKTGQIKKLDNYVWEEACRLIRRWKDSETMIPICLSVNVSRIDVMESSFLDTLDSLIEKYGLSPSDLHLEITEGAYMDRPEMLIDVVDQLHSHGFLVEMDDFGSGFSSLNMLKDVQVDALKMDVRFLKGDTRREKGSMIISAIVRMAKELEIPVITEGVETKDQASYLSSIGCSLMQGYLFSRPLPLEEFEELLVKEKIKNDMSVSDRQISCVWSSDQDDSRSSFISKIIYADYKLAEDGRIVHCDEAFTYLTGYTREDVTDRKLCQNDLIPEEDLCEFRKAVDYSKKCGNTIYLKHRIRRKDGTCVNVYGAAVLVMDEYSGEVRSKVRILKAENDF